MIKIKYNTYMPTEIRERLVVYDKDEKDILHIFYNTSDEITITDDVDYDNPHAFYCSLNNEDWQQIKQFIDKYFNS